MEYWPSGIQWFFLTFFRVKR
ncbi:hypothetical protein D021_3295A, partial [Vibrio parahaemolyticus 10296]